MWERHDLRMDMEGVIEVLGALSLVLQVVTWLLLFRCFSSKVTLRVFKPMWDNMFVFNQQILDRTTQDVGSTILCRNTSADTYLCIC